ncbi:viperin family antiviral radical SAM protein [Lewinella sp. JB7]|uniref:viperin family antiviral radical SAM protein n=1 Tax=Lewinella sp. JB7 TaxID=2962887 RepID=UPI0020C97F26|nr:viperin family antiviral radical SAM protein [Lewinella sp. JB7]MCP9234740.1 viperin family antiviral radical SAM protein [Lewinella sp. JB7]
MASITPIPSVNFHLIKPCNMGCKYCFARFNDVDNQKLLRGGPDLHSALRIVDALADFGFQKITFAGGEPTLYPHLKAVVGRAKAHGLTTMLVTNGSKLNSTFYASYVDLLDWLTISVDSLSIDTNLRIGRATHGGRVLSRAEYEQRLLEAKAQKFRIKINTVVSRYNYTEDMNSFLDAVHPERWKVFQALPIRGENDDYRSEFEITTAEYKGFLVRHSRQPSLIVEDNDAMKGSYCMVNPAGAFYTNAEGILRESRPILEAGVEAAYQEMGYSTIKFLDRGGVYDWGNKGIYNIYALQMSRMIPLYNQTDVRAILPCCKYFCSIVQ